MGTEQYWASVDWDAPAAAIDIVERFVANVRASDGVELHLAVGEVGEAEAAERVVALARERPGIAARWSRLPEIAVSTGGIPDAVAATHRLRRDSADQTLSAVRERVAPYVALSPVRNGGAWAAGVRPEPGFVHLAVDNASRDDTAERLEAAGVRVLRRHDALPRLGSWRAALAAFAHETTADWMKWLFAGDELLPGAADLLDAARAAHPEARLIICEYEIREPDGRLTHWRTVPTTRLLEPDESMALAAKGGNWFGSPIGHALHRDLIDEVDFGCQEWVADWQACLGIAARHPVLYVAESIGVFDVPSRRYYSAKAGAVDSLVQELSMRMQALDRLRQHNPERDLAEVERTVNLEAAMALSQRVSVVHSAGPPPAKPDGSACLTVLADREERGSSDPVIAVHAPRAADPAGRDFNGYAPLFARRHARYAYLPQLATDPRITAARAAGVPARIDGLDLEIVTNARELDRVADVLVCFEGRPYLSDFAPPREFTGLKAYHVMDFVFHAREAHEALNEGGVDVALGYARHDEYSPFFGSLYPSFAGRVVPVPFGYGDRFKRTVPFRERERTVLGIGSVNPVDDPLCPPGELDEYVAFYRAERWTHRWRRTLLERAAALGDIFVSRFPVFPETKDPTYDAVALLNAHAMFANDEGLMAFPPARTYEGPACGSLLVAADTPAVRELGFEHGENALLHRAEDVEDFARVVRAAVREPERLEAMAAAGASMVRARYSHEAVVDRLHGELCRRWAA
jgi:hypothetical protein